MIICCYNKKENLKSKDKQTMDTSDLKEKNFEADIERYLITEGGYVKGNQDTYDKERAIDMPVLISFIEKTQAVETLCNQVWRQGGKTAVPRVSG